ncbi:SMP-30/gluconolactonase/LRE family protein [uncultured Ferrimonas sp.]|uniref:SMP-30/gluconolactonase/LRE family protein n=1 Tax=uncultured Ferrimonas sp. TaxID=432640 RepID=UPI0026186B6A|nr:SMP-30/gluconolactonase/LRE family protein [uncultured Ferrimonas sp.]
MPAWKLAVASAVVALLAYLSLWPVPIEPTTWQPPIDRGYQLPFNPNQHLAQLERLNTPAPGPEGFASNSKQQLYFGLSNGDIGRLTADGIDIVANTNGRPLGLRFDHDDNLYIADAYQGLLRLTNTGQLQTVLTEVAGEPLRYANSLALAADGTVFMSESSTRHAAADYGTYETSLIDINEHGGSGRVIKFDPSSGHARVLLTKLNFTNGIELADNDNSLLITETGHYRVLKLYLRGAKQGQTEVFLENLPGFPDNLSRDSDGTYWLGLVSPRNALLDSIADKPAIRKLVQRLPAFLRPQASRYGHLIGFDAAGEIRYNLQDPEGSYAHITGAERIGDTLYISSLHEPAIAMLPWPIKTLW